MSIKITPKILEILDDYTSSQRLKILNMAWESCVDSGWMNTPAVEAVVREAIEMYAVIDAIVYAEDEDEDEN
jgi:hypothetical protein